MRESYIDQKTRAIVTLSPSLSKPNKWWVNRVNVPAPHRGKRLSSRLLQEACRDADKEGVTLRCHVSPDASGEGLSFDELRAFYSRYGFKDPRRPGDMTRAPGAEFPPTQTKYLL